MNSLIFENRNKMVRAATYQNFNNPNVVKMKDEVKLKEQPKMNDSKKSLYKF